MLKDAYLFNVDTKDVAPLTKQPVIEIFSYQMPTVYDSKTQQVYTADWSKKKIYSMQVNESDWRLVQELNIFL